MSNGVEFQLNEESCKHYSHAVERLLTESMLGGV